MKGQWQGTNVLNDSRSVSKKNLMSMDYFCRILCDTHNNIKKFIIESTSGFKIYKQKFKITLLRKTSKKEVRIDSD